MVIQDTLKLVEKVAYSFFQRIYTSERKEMLWVNKLSWEYGSENVRTCTRVMQVLKHIKSLSRWVSSMHNVVLYVYICNDIISKCQTFSTTSPLEVSESPGKVCHSSHSHTKHPSRPSPPMPQAPLRSTRPSIWNPCLLTLTRSGIAVYEIDFCHAT
jgi:hypothetical protein